MEWVIYDKSGTTERCRVKNVEYNGSFMGDRTVSCTVESPVMIDFAIGDFLTYRGETFFLDYAPSQTKNAKANSVRNAFEYELIFHTFDVYLQNCLLLDYVPYGNDYHFNPLPSYSFMGTAQTFAERIQANMDREYPGEWTISVHSSVQTDDTDIEIDNTSCWNALVMFNKKWGLNFSVSGKHVYIGYPEDSINHTFYYGKNNGLYRIEREVDSDEAIITRLYAYGSDRNIPTDYNKRPSDFSGKKYLMLPGYLTTGKSYIESDNVSIYGVREYVVSFEDIYPSITGTEIPGVGRIDEILSAEQITSETEANGTFKVTLRNIGFDINDHLTQDTATISMKSGSLVGYDFEITEVTQLENGNYELTLNKSTRDNFTVPNAGQNISAGDQFVLLGISMPDEYVENAEQKLLATAQAYLAAHDHAIYSYSIGMDELYMARNSELHDEIKEGLKLNLYDADLGLDHSIIIQSLRIREGGDVPEYEITLCEKPLASTIDKLWDAVSDIRFPVNTTVGNISFEELNRRYLRKDVDDLALGNIRFAKQISSETFASGLTGTGWRITQEGDGEMRSLFLREWLETPELRYNRVTVTGDEFWVATGVKADKVEGNTITAKLEEGEVIAVHEGDILRGIYHHENGFSTSFIKVVSVDTSAGTFTYEKIRGADPVRFMTFARQGNDTDPERQRSIYISGLEGYQRFLGGVNSADITFDNIYAQFGNLDGLVTPYFGTLSGEGIYIRKGYIEGSIHVTGGNAATQEFVQTEVGQSIANISVGVGNLLLNTGFTGDYSTIDLTTGSQLATDTTLFSDPLKFWTVSGAAAAGEEARSQSGFACTFSGTLSQSPIAAIEAEQDYTVSVWAKGTGTLSVKVGGASGSFALTSAYQKFVVKLKTTDTSGFSIAASASATIYELKLERGTVATDWSPSSSDNDKSEAQAISYKYVLDAIQNETDIYGGLVLTNILMVGNYTNGKMTTVTGGLSGVYHDGNDVAFWAGGTLEQAIRAVGDPSRTSNVANAVITHGGLAILNNAYVRGKIYATDGEFTGTVYANAGVLQNVTVRTSEEGQRIEMNPASQNIALYNANNLLVGSWYFEDTGGAIELFNTNSTGSSRSSNSVLTGFDLRIQTQNGSMLGAYSYSSVYLSTTGKSFYVSLNASDGLSVIFEGLPKSKDNLASGRIYVDGDTLKIA